MFEKKGSLKTRGGDFLNDILIVEDNKEIATLLCDFLRAENYIVSVADSGEKALSIFEKYGAKLVVLDVMVLLTARIGLEFDFLVEHVVLKILLVERT